MALAMVLVGVGASAQPAQNGAATPAAQVLPAEPPTSIAALRAAAGDLVNLSGWRPASREEAASLMERAGAAMRRANREARSERAVTLRQEVLRLYWAAHRSLQSAGSAFGFSQALLAVDHREAACALMAHIANVGGYPGMPPEAIRQQMAAVASCQPEWVLQETRSVAVLPSVGSVVPPSPSVSGPPSPTPATVVSPLPPPTFRIVRRAGVHVWGPWIAIGRCSRSWIRWLAGHRSNSMTRSLPRRTSCGRACARTPTAQLSRISDSVWARW